MRYYPVSDEGDAQAPYGERRPRVARRRIDLTNARDGQELVLGGNAIWACVASSYNAELEISLHEQGQGLLPFLKGTFVKAGPFSKLYLTNSAQSGEYIDLVVIREERGVFEIENPGSTFDTVQSVVPTTLTATADVNIAASTNTQAIAANANRVELILRSLSSNTNTARLSEDPGAAGGKGLPLEPGQSITLNVTETVYAYNLDDTTDGTQVTIAILEVIT